MGQRGVALLIFLLYFSAISRLSHGYITVIPRLSHGYLTVILRLSHGYLSFIISRLSFGYPFYFSSIYFVGHKQTTSKMSLSCGAGPVAATRLSLPTWDYFDYFELEN